MTDFVTYTLRLDDRPSQYRKNGFPVVVFLHQNKKQKKVGLGLFFEKADWDFKKQLPKKNKRVALLINKKKNILDEVHLNSLDGKVYDLNYVKNLLLNVSSVKTSGDSFLVFFRAYMHELFLSGKISTFKKYENAINQLLYFRKNISFSDLNYLFFHNYKEWQIGKGNSKSTIHTYLNTYRSVYNEAVRRGVVKDKSPFIGVFKSVFVKSNRTKKRNITKDSFKILEAASCLTNAEERAVELFLLLFYFGGQDLKDVYYLKRSSVANGRVYFVRGKLDGAGYEFDLKIVSKAQKIIDKHSVAGEFVFPWRKDFTGYKTFRDNFRRNLIKAQFKLNINVLPLGGSLGVKVARHSFATIAKNLFIDSDLLRELMGHERNDVDTIYKDKYPENVRDSAHLQVID